MPDIRCIPTVRIPSSFANHPLLARIGADPRGSYQSKKNGESRTRTAATTEPCERPGDSGRGTCRRAHTRNSDCRSDCSRAAQELLQRVAVGDVQETESDLELAVAEREPPTDPRVPLRQGWSLKLPLAATGVCETHGRRQWIRDRSPVGQHQCRRTELRVRRCQQRTIGPCRVPRRCTDCWRA